MVASRSLCQPKLSNLIVPTKGQKEDSSDTEKVSMHTKTNFSAIRPYKKSQIFLGSKGDELIVAQLIKPKPLSWYVVQDDKCLAFIHIQILSDDIYGDSIPMYYKSKESILIELTSNSYYEEIDLELVRAAVRESQRLGLFGRTYTRASKTDTLSGSSIPFYNKLGFKCVNGQTQRLVESCIKLNERIPSSCQEVFMYLPKEAISELFENTDI